MTISKYFSIALFSTILAVTLLIHGSSDRQPGEAIETITAGELRSTLYFLASDEMQGREAGTLANSIASSYLAHRFELLGLESLEDQDYFQYFTVTRSRLLPSRNRFQLTRLDAGKVRTGTLQEDYYPSTLSSSATAAASAVFAGYGITAPEYDYDDYEGLNVKGKVALVMLGEPGEEDPEGPFEGILTSDYSLPLDKILNAQQHGASGVILFNPEDQGGLERRAEIVWPDEISRAGLDLQVWLEAVKIPVVRASTDLLSILFDDNPPDFKALREEIDTDYQSRSGNLVLPPNEVMIQTAIDREEEQLRNVIARLPGSDPALRDEVVIVSAHFDHVGVADGRVYNGADDDASGTAAVLEIAEAFTRTYARPRRSILFALWNAEEKGLLGSRFYAARPPVSLSKTTALFQMDMIGRNQEVPDSEDPRFYGMRKQTPEENRNMVHVVGYSRSNSLSRLVRDVNRSVGLDLQFELDNTGLNILRRSDNWPFLVNGVPALFFTTGLHPDYHTPEDTADKLNYSKMERIAQLTFLCAWQTANTTDPPTLSR